MPPRERRGRAGAGRRPCGLRMFATGTTGTGMGPEGSPRASNRASFAADCAPDDTVGTDWALTGRREAQTRLSGAPQEHSAAERRRAPRQVSPGDECSPGAPLERIRPVGRLWPRPGRPIWHRMCAPGTLGVVRRCFGTSRRHSGPKRGRVVRPRNTRGADSRPDRTGGPTDAPRTDRSGRRIDRAAHCGGLVRCCNASWSGAARHRLLSITNTYQATYAQWY